MDFSKLPGNKVRIISLKAFYLILYLNLEKARILLYFTELYSPSLFTCYLYLASKLQGLDVYTKAICLEGYKEGRHVLRLDSYIVSLESTLLADWRSLNKLLQ